MIRKNEDTMSLAADHFEAKVLPCLFASIWMDCDARTAAIESQAQVRKPHLYKTAFGWYSDSVFRSDFFRSDLQPKGQVRPFGDSTVMKFDTGPLRLGLDR